METKSVQLPVYYFGTPIALITTINVAGNVNITPMSSAWALGDRIVLGLSETSQGRENLLRERQAVLNFPDASLWQSVEAIARLTGRNPVPEHKKKYGYTYASDKLASLGLTTVASEIVRPYRIQECPLQIEVELLASHDPALPLPGSPESFQILETRIVKCHAHESILRLDGNHIDTEQWKPLFYIFRNYATSSQNLGGTFKA